MSTEHGRVDSWIEKLLGCSHLTEAEVQELCGKAREILINEANVQPVKCPVTGKEAAAAEGAGGE